VLPKPRSTGRAAVGVLYATLASLAALFALVALMTAAVPAGEGDSWVRGAMGLILAAPFLAVLLAGYYVVAAIVTAFAGRWRMAALAVLAAVTGGALATLAAFDSHRYDVSLSVGSVVLADLLVGSAVLYASYGRRLEAAARSVNRGTGPTR
jgi:hypothetical protein